MQDNSKERFPIVDEEGRVVGAATRGECHNGSKLLHPVVHLHGFNSRGEVYLQKRPEWKDIQPGKWDTSVGGHIDYGETPEQALQGRIEGAQRVGNVWTIPETALKPIDGRKKVTDITAPRTNNGIVMERAFFFTIILIRRNM